MTKDEALRLASVVLDHCYGQHTINDNMIEQTAKVIQSALEAKDKPYAFEASMYSNDRMKVDPVTGNVSIGTVTKACGLECDCTDVCKQDDYKALWQQMCERCDELDKKLAQPEHGWTSERIAGMTRLKAQQDSRLEPQRTWVGLTDKEIEAIWKIAMFTDYGVGAELSNQPFVHYARAIEAKLKEKNT
jgi:hypothetical protein